MYKITVKGKAETKTRKKDCNGIDCQDEFTEYFGSEQQSLIDKGVHDGYMRFELQGRSLFTVTTYSSPVELTSEELKILEDYTTGQWSDGIGEGFEQFECGTDSNGKEIYISPWYHGQVTTVTQEIVK